MDNVCLVPCATWIRRGVCKQTPDKVELTKDDLAQIIEETRGKLKDVQMGQNDDAEEDDNEDEDNTADDGVGDAERAQPSNGDTYDMEHYDNEEEEGDQNVLALGQMSEFASNADDPYVTQPDAEESDSEAEDLEVRPDENLIVTGLVDGDASTLVFHVFNEDEGSMYVHHDIILSSFPICVEWLNYDPEHPTPGNLVAVGSMSPVIEVWDVDVINSFEPAFKLGKRGKKKKSKLGVGHTDAVLSLAWNRHIGHVMASGSADHSVLLWDLETQKKASSLHCREKVQSVSWHPAEMDRLLSADCAKDLRVWECRMEESKRWQLTGEVECAVWDHFNPNGILACTDDGQLHYIDTRTEKETLWSIQAHEEACTSLVLSPEVPGCLVTVSPDKTLKVWDVSDRPSAPVASRPMKLGALHCAAFCPDLPWMLCLGGDNKENSFRLWDIRESVEVRERFGSRPLSRVLPEPDVGLPAESGADAMDTESTTDQLDSMSLAAAGPSGTAAAAAPRTASGKKLKKRHKARGAGK